MNPSRVMTLKGGTRPPWVGLGAAVTLQIASGNAYNFPLYSHSLKSVLGFNQQQLTILGVANDIGENVGILPGIFCNKFPPWVLLSIGAFACFFGYGILWLAVTRTVESLPFWLNYILSRCLVNLLLLHLMPISWGNLKKYLLWIALCIATNSSAWFSTAIVVTNMKNFPHNRGTVAGILKGYSGLSGAVFTEIYSVLLGHSSSKLLLFLSLGIPTLCFVMMYFVRPCTPASGDDPAERCHFHFVEAASVVLGLYILTTTTLDNFVSLSLPVSYTFVGIMVILLMAPLAIPVKMTLYPSSRSKLGRLGQPVRSSDQLGQEEGNLEKREPLLTPSSSTANVDDSDSSVSDVDVLLAEGEGAVKKKRPRRGDDFTFTEALVKADFWLLFFVFFVGVGSGVTVLNNLAQIGIAQGIHDTTILMSLFSFCNFVGRLGGGAVSEYFVRSATVPRTVWITFTQVVMIITYLLFASALDGTLYVATALLGICYGVQFSIMVPTASELFGLRNFGVFYNFMSLGNPIGALLFSGLLAGYIYDSEAAKQHVVSCVGPSCFRFTFLVLVCVCGVGTILSMVLTLRIKPVYKMLYRDGSFRGPQNSNH